MVRPDACAADDAEADFKFARAAAEGESDGRGEEPACRRAELGRSLPGSRPGATCGLRVIGVDAGEGDGMARAGVAGMLCWRRAAALRTSCSGKESKRSLTLSAALLLVLLLVPKCFSVIRSALC